MFTGLANSGRQIKQAGRAIMQRMGQYHSLRSVEEECERTGRPIKQCGRVIIQFFLSARKTTAQTRGTVHDVNRRSGHHDYA